MGTCRGYETDSSGNWACRRREGEVGGSCGGGDGAIRGGMFSLDSSGSKSEKEGAMSRSW